VIQLLVSRGAVVDATNKAGQTPLALTLPRESRGSQRPDAAERAARAKAAETMLRSLGASR
jgi:hypothetical protein